MTRSTSDDLILYPTGFRPDGVLVSWQVAPPSGRYHGEIHLVGGGREDLTVVVRRESSDGHQLVVCNLEDDGRPTTSAGVEALVMRRLWCDGVGSEASEVRVA